MTEPIRENRSLIQQKITELTEIFQNKKKKHLCSLCFLLFKMFIGLRLPCLFAVIPSAFSP
jgi:hypothetical protein